MSELSKILYVDDEFINLELFRLNFEYELDVIVAESGKEGLEILNQQKIDLVISDLKMPEMDGIEFIREIKMQTPEKICILLTAYVESDAMLQAINEDLIFKYVIKPWNRDDLKEIIDEALSKVTDSI